MGAAAGLVSALKIAGGVLGAYSAYAGASAQASSAKATAAIADANARNAEAQSNETLARGAREERMFRQRAAQQSAAQESQLAASGAQLSGSALNVMGDTRIGIEEDVAALRYNVAQERWAQQVQAVNFRNQASAARSSAKNAKIAGALGVGTALLGTFSTIKAGSTPTKATYTSGSGITVKPMYEDFYYGKHNKFGTFTDNNIAENWWE